MNEEDGTRYMSPEERRKWSRGVELHEGALARHGWRERESAEDRHRALERSVREDGWARTVDRLLFMRNIAGVRHNPGLHKTAEDDLEWLRRWEVGERGEEDVRREGDRKHRVRAYEKEDGERVRPHLARNPRRR